MSSKSTLVFDLTNLSISSNDTQVLIERIGAFGEDVVDCDQIDRSSQTGTRVTRELSSVRQPESCKFRDGLYKGVQPDLISVRQSASCSLTPRCGTLSSLPPLHSAGGHVCPAFFAVYRFLHLSSALVRFWRLPLRRSSFFSLGISVGSASVWELL